MATEELCLICWARGRGGMNVGPGGFPTIPTGGNYPSYGTQDMGQKRGGKLMNSRGRMGGIGSPSRNTVQNSTTGHSIHMRGLPFESTLQDVLDFFHPMVPVDVRLLYEASGRPKGECDVDFNTHLDCEQAMSKDKQNMGHRYIELFLKSSPSGATVNGWGRSLSRSQSTPQIMAPPQMSTGQMTAEQIMTQQMTSSQQSNASSLGGSSLGGSSLVGSSLGGSSLGGSSLSQLGNNYSNYTQVAQAVNAQQMAAAQQQTAAIPQGYSNFPGQPQPTSFGNGTQSSTASYTKTISNPPIPVNNNNTLPYNPGTLNSAMSQGMASQGIAGGTGAFGY